MTNKSVMTFISVNKISVCLSDYNMQISEVNINLHYMPPQTDYKFSIPLYMVGYMQISEVNTPAQRQTAVTAQITVTAVCLSIMQTRKDKQQ